MCDPEDGLLLVTTKNAEVSCAARWMPGRSIIWSASVVWLRLA